MTPNNQRIITQYLSLSKLNLIFKSAFLRRVPVPVHGTSITTQSNFPVNFFRFVSSSWNWILFIPALEKRFLASERILSLAQRGSCKNSCPVPFKQKSVNAQLKYIAILSFVDQTRDFFLLLQRKNLELIGLADRKSYQFRELHSTHYLAFYSQSHQLAAFVLNFEKALSELRYVKKILLMDKLE